MDAIFSINLQELFVTPRFFFYLGIYVGIAISFYEGYKRKYPFTDWTFVITFSLICALIGSKLITYNGADWQSIIRFSFPDNERVSLIGWKIGVLVGAIIAIKLIGIPKGSFDTIAYAFPVGLIITRIGCLIGGCCYGTPVNSFFAVNYSGSPENLHPTQFYEILLGIILISSNFILQRKNFFKKPGNLGLFTMMSYFFFRFFIEFIRGGGVYAGGLKIVQWIAVVAVILLGIFIIIYEKRQCFAKLEKRDKKYFSEPVVIIAGSALSVFAFNILSYFESVLLISLIVMFLLNYFQKFLFKTADYKIFRNQVAMIVLSIFFMSFTINNDTIIHNHQNDINDSEIISKESNDEVRDYVKYTSDFGMGFRKGKYSTVCGDPYEYRNIELEYEGIYSFDGKNNLYFQTGGFTSDNSSMFKQFSQFGTRHVIGYKNNFMKFGLGSQCVNSGTYYGNFVFFDTEYSFIPIIELRIGRRYYFDGYWGAYHHPYIGSSIRVGLGYNFNESINMSIGLDAPSGLYLQGRLFLGELFYLSPYVSYGSNDNYFFGSKFGIRFPSGKLKNQY
jgi:prolipoprotein diacylglyceryltransferase